MGEMDEWREGRIHDGSHGSYPKMIHFALMTARLCWPQTVIL